MSNLCESGEQQAVIRSLKLSREFDVATEIERRIAFLCGQLVNAQRRALVSTPRAARAVG